VKPRVVLLTALLGLSLAAMAAAGQSQERATDSESLGQLRNELQGIRQRFPGDMSIYMKNLSSGDEIDLDADTVYETFSVIKLAIAAEVLREAEAGKFSLSDRVAITASDRRLPSGVLYSLEPGLQPTVHDLLTLMIIISDNEATDILATKVGRANVTAYMHNLGLKNTSIRFSDLDWDRTWLGTLDPSYKNARGDQTINFPFGKYSDAQVNAAFSHTIYDAGIYFGHSTTREIGRLLEWAADGKLVSAKASHLLLDILEKQQVNDRFPRYLKDVRIAHKTGDGQPFIANDAGVLWVRNQPIVLVVFTGHHRGQTAPMHDSIAQVAALVVRHYGGRLTPDFKP
jgi:beta-lactamase class A